MIFRNDKERKVPGPVRAGDPLIVPLLPLRDIIVFPHMVVPLFVGRQKSIAALEEAMNHDKLILLASQRKAKTNEPTPEDIFEVGTLAVVIQMLRLPDNTIKVLVEGKKRARIQEHLPNEAFFLVRVDEIREVIDTSVETQALVRSVKETFESYVKLSKKVPPEMALQIEGVDNPARLADMIPIHLASLKIEEKQELLEMPEATPRLERLFGLMKNEIEILQVEKRIRTRVKKQMEKTQKEYYLNEQMRAIQKELGEKDEFKNEIQDLEEKIKSKKMSKEATEKAEKEIKKLKMMSPMSAEATVVRNYIDWIVSLPWAERSEDKLDIVEAERILEADHYGLKQVKERIIEYLAVQKLVQKNKGPILCFVGPPGVGKTSLGKSIARATGRSFVRLSLGGVRDEAEIRGHRRTYIGALPGKIIQMMKKAGTKNPVFLLDEVDKMSTDFRGDPAAALLEVLDPEQNHTFNDHYLDMDYDLSEVMFITTANTLHAIPRPLQDRMEILRLPGYTDLEKLQIARKFLVPKQREAHGLKEHHVEIPSFILLKLIREYTKEAGVRNLEREIATVCRKIAKEVVKSAGAGAGADPSTKLNLQLVQRFLGVPKFRFGEKEEKNEIGVATGLAWTEFGGELLNTEVTILPGKGKLTITGKLGDVMQESAQAALSYVRSRSAQLGLAKEFYQKVDIHVHIPEGSIPKDGPSAGITIATAIASALMRRPVRCDIAMTGEITLRGRVLPIGGLKEKLLAAHRGRIRTVIIPRDNEKDLKEIPMKVRKDLDLIPVRHMDEVLRTAVVLEHPEKLLSSPDVTLDLEDLLDRVDKGKQPPGSPPAAPSRLPEMTAH